jgi:G3E family GTPase
MADSPPILAPPPRTEPVVVPGRGRIPVTLLTGFLGAGKTTLLNRILSGDHGLRVGVLVNDFGAINIDASLVESVEENTINLINGCVCCEVRDDLVVSLEELLNRSQTVDYVILEASGVADPGGIVMTFLDWKYEQMMMLDSITCLIDAEGIFAQADDQELTGLKLRQIGFADLVVLNKTDLVGREHIEVVRDWIGLHMNRVRIVESVRGDVPLEILLGSGRFDGVSALNHEAARQPDPAGDMFDRWAFTTERRFSIADLESMVERELPASVYRCKGIVYGSDQPDVALVLQIVGRRTTLEVLDGPGPGRSEIVAIGRGINGDDLNDLFAGCLA